MDSQVYTYEQALTTSLAYFNGDELAAKVWVDKYSLRTSEGEILESSPEQMHRRIAREFARIEAKKFKTPLTENQIYALLEGFKRIVPQGSPMFGIGNTNQIVSLSNCFLLDVPLDSYSSIMQVDEQLVNISKRRGGVGIDLSNLRPAGAITHNAAKSSSGIVTWMRRYSNSIREVGQAGRRGALMLTLSIHHPDILAFCTIKNDPNEVTGANISVRLTRAFLDAVKNGEDYELCFPVDYRERGIEPIVSQRISAKQVWDTIIHSAHMRAEPGLLMWDNVVEQTPADCYARFRSRGTNPCCVSQLEDYYVITKNGLKEIKEINKDDLIFINQTGEWAKTSGYFDRGTAKVYRVKFSNGEEVTMTSNHKLCVINEKRVGTRIESIEGNNLVELGNLKVGAKIAVHTEDASNQIEFGNYGTYQEGLIMGWIAGDGCLSFASEKEDYPMSILAFWEQEHDVGEMLLNHFNQMGYELSLTTQSINNVKRIASTKFTEDFVNKYQYNIWTFKSETERTPFLDKASKEFIRGYIQAYFTADGTVCVNHETRCYNIQFASINKKRLRQINHFLSVFGVKGSIGLLRAAGVSEFKNGGKYQTKDCWRITITGIDNIKKFKAHFGFLSAVKQSRLDEICEIEFSKTNKERNFTKITSIEAAGEVPVGCIEVEKYHKFTLNGLISGNSEINLSPLDSCRLLLINLLTYVTNPFTPTAIFDFARFRQDAKLAQRLMDDLVDLESEKIDAIIAKVQSDPEPAAVKEREIALWRRVKANNDEGRRTGTGITALGDTLAALGIPYGSDAAIQTTEDIYRALKLACYESSVDMAEELGAFAGYSPDAEKDCPFIQRIAQEDPALYARMVQYGRRNVSLTTTAPAGSVSLLTRTTSGIEPLFMIGYTRRKKVNPNDKAARIDFVDPTGDSWQNFTVYHPQVQTWMDITGETDVTKSPWHGNCAENIDWVNRVKLQAAAQRHVCHAISSTLNLPENVTEEQVSTIYQTAFESGLKGITVYRKNCRSGVMVEEPKKQEKDAKERGDSIVKTKAPKRPAALPAEMHHFTISGHRYYVAVGLLDGEPYEVLGGINHDSEGDPIIPRSVTTGTIVKHARGKYTFKTDENEHSLASPNSDGTIDAITRMVSTALRHGADISFVVHQLEKTRGEMKSFAKTLARTLKKHIKDGTAVSGEKCESCGGTNIVRENGCKICKDCGQTSCS